MEASEERAQRRGLTAAMREGERVMPLELFFDLVFVLALTQCTALMVHDHTMAGIGQGLLLLALLWWSWTGYAWLTSVLDPEEGGVRLALVASMAGFLVAALAVPHALDDDSLIFALAYAAVRFAHIGLFYIASRDDPGLRRSITGFGFSTTLLVVMMVVGAVIGGDAQIVIWSAALLFDVAEPYVFGSEGWKLVPGHFAERHGLIIIVSLGESIVALGIGSEIGLSAVVVLAAVLGIALVFALWWLYFDLVMIANARRLARAAPGAEQNEMARDVYSYLHFFLVAGIELAAYGLHDVLAHPEEHLKFVPAFALLGGVAVYLLGHVAIRLRGAGTLSTRRLLVALLMLALIPLAEEISAVSSLGIAVAVLAGLIVYETRSYGDRRQQARHEFAAEGPEGGTPIASDGPRA